MSFVKCGLHVVVIVRDEGRTKLAVRLLDCAPAYGSVLQVPCLVTVSHSKTHHSPLNSKRMSFIYLREQEAVIYF